jgi:hypothetical protein
VATFILLLTRDSESNVLVSWMYNIYDSKNIKLSFF